ncbi:MAG: hypothetical protein K5660_07760 [Paludibacteraceae bacterium]|nr:hypothetical protein [Paludibacteraceae bacterium]
MTVAEYDRHIVVSQLIEQWNSNYHLLVLNDDNRQVLNRPCDRFGKSSRSMTNCFKRSESLHGLEKKSVCFSIA